MTEYFEDPVELPRFISIGGVMIPLEVGGVTATQLAASKAELDRLTRLFLESVTWERRPEVVDRLYSSEWDALYFVEEDHRLTRSHRDKHRRHSQRPNGRRRGT